MMTVNPSSSSTPAKWVRPPVSPRVLFHSDRCARNRLLGGLAALCLLYGFVCHYCYQLRVQGISPSESSRSVMPSCAILLYGKIQAFPVVWPALRRHVVLPNAAYGCDYFVNVLLDGESTSTTSERLSYSADAIKKLERYIESNLYYNDPIVMWTMST